MIESGSLRFRMIVLFCAVVGVLLAGSYFGFYLLLRGEVRRQMERQLTESARLMIADLEAEPGDVSDLRALDLPGQYFELLDSSGHVVEKSMNLQGRPLNLDTGKLDFTNSAFQTLQDGSRGQMRAVLFPFRWGKDQFVLVVAIPTHETDQVLASLKKIILFVWPLSLLLTAAISAWYVGRSLQPISDLTRRAAELAEHVADPQRRDLWAPLPTANPHDELGRLAGTFNQLFARVDAVLSQLRQFVTDASHELRTPLSVLRGETELVLSEPRPVEEYQKTLHVIDTELKKVTRIVEGLFTLSMADAGQLRLAKEPLYLNEVLDEACAMGAPRAQAKDIVIERELKQEVPYLGDETFLRQLFVIFLDNAIKYSPCNTRIRVKLITEDGVVRARFEDHGIGISNEHRARIFERFYRVVHPGVGEAQSGGLGLAIAQAIVRAQGGSIECESTPGVGSTFTVSLPLRVSS